MPPSLFRAGARQRLSAASAQMVVADDGLNLSGQIDQIQGQYEPVNAAASVARIGPSVNTGCRSAPAADHAEPVKSSRRGLLTADTHEGLLRELTATRKGITLAEIRDALIERGIQPGSLTTIWWTLRRLGLTHKKSAARGRAGSARCG